VTSTRDPVVRTILWRLLGAPLFRYSLHHAYPIRRLLIRAFGGRTAPTSRLRATCRIDRPWNLSIGDRSIVGDDAVIRAREPIRIGDRCTISQMTLLVTELLDPAVPGHPVRRGPIDIGDDCWVATETLVSPGVRIGRGTVVGARALVEGDLPEWSVAVGQPARRIKARAFGAPRRETHGERDG
jgi:putative colanic acid biosynthesis acetyltransferase WcaF